MDRAETLATYYTRDPQLTLQISSQSDEQKPFSLFAAPITRSISEILWTLDLVNRSMVRTETLATNYTRDPQQTLQISSQSDEQKPFSIFVAPITLAVTILEKRV